MLKITIWLKKIYRLQIQGNALRDPFLEPEKPSRFPLKHKTLQVVTTAIPRSKTSLEARHHPQNIMVLTNTDTQTNGIEVETQK